MTPTGFSEDALIEKPAIDLLGSLGWETYNAFGEFEQGQSPLGRENKAEVVLASRLLQKAVFRLDEDAIESGDKLIPIENIARESNIYYLACIAGASFSKLQLMKMRTGGFDTDLKLF